MIKKIFSVIFLLTLLAGVPAANGEVAPGNWKIHSAYAMPVSKVIDTGTRVFTLAGGNLFVYDKQEGESRSLTSRNILSDNDIHSIYYDNEGKRLLIAYSNGNIDLLDKDMNVVNISDIQVSGWDLKTINDVCFTPQYIYVATDGGLVVLSSATHETVKSGTYPGGVKGVTVMADHIVIKNGDQLLVIPVESRINTLDLWKPLCSWGDVVELVTAGQGKILARRNSKDEATVSLITVNTDNWTIEQRGSLLKGSYQAASPFIATSNPDVWRFTVANVLYEYNPETGLKKLCTIPENLSGNSICCYDSTAEIWAAGIDGIGCYSYDGNGFTTLSDKYMPEEFCVSNVAYIIPGNDKSRTYFTNLGPTVYRLGLTTGSDNVNQRQASARHDSAGDEFENITAWPVEGKFSLVTGYQKSLGEYALATTRLCEDPDDPDTYYIGTGNDGLLKITGGQLAGRYDSDNGPFVAEWGVRVFDVSVDRAGNLWVISHTGPGTSGVSVLSAEKRRLDPSEVKASDWTVLDIDGYSNNKDAITLHCKKSNMVFITDATVATKLVAIDTKGTLNDFSDDVVKVWTKFTDQDGKVFDPDRHTSLIEDLDGRVWLGTNHGIVEISNPSAATNDNMTITRIKVPRNDGTGTADYLCESDLIYDLSVDHANRKWIATEASGVTLVSERGNEIIERFTTSNSPLPSNRVNAVYAHPLTNSVYMATESGLMEYGGTASPSAEKMDEIFAYPNPVKPDFMGHVTITGLTNGALVKIADSGGNVIWQGKADGGMCRWNVTDLSGRRPKSGVYYIMASKSGEGISTSGAVGKIAIIN